MGRGVCEILNAAFREIHSANFLLFPSSKVGTRGSVPLCGAKVAASHLDGHLAAKMAKRKNGTLKQKPSPQPAAGTASSNWKKMLPSIRKPPPKLTPMQQQRRPQQQGHHGQKHRHHRTFHLGEY